jgi:hypothetical protein
MATTPMRTASIEEAGSIIGALDLLRDVKRLQDISVRTFNKVWVDVSEVDGKLVYAGFRPCFDPYNYTADDLQPWIYRLERQLNGLP